MQFVIETQDNQGQITRDKVICDTIEEAQTRWQTLCLKELRRNIIGTHDFECWIKFLTR